MTEWLKDVCQQMASTHGDIGESKETHIINEHDKFTETAKVRGAEGKREGGKGGGKEGGKEGGRGGCFP